MKRFEGSTIQDTDTNLKYSRGGQFVVFPSCEH